jgi:plasmid stability protein
MGVLSIRNLDDDVKAAARLSYSREAITSSNLAGPCQTVPMWERATLRLDSGDELRVEVERDELSRDEILVRRAPENGSRVAAGLLAVIDEHLATAEPHPAGTTDRLLAADRERPY